MTTITQTYAEDTKLALPARARTGGPRRPRSEQPAQQDWFERYTSQASYGSHMPLDIRFNWDWLNPLNIIPAFMLLLVLITIVGLALG